MLVHKINTSEALRESKSHQHFLYLILLLTLALIASLLLAAWFYGSSAREHQMAENLLIKSRELEVQTYLLNAIKDLAATPLPAEIAVLVLVAFIRNPQDDFKKLAKTLSTAYNVTVDATRIGKFSLCTD